MASFLRELNASQQKAAAHVSGPLLVVAGAGSGKTRTLTYRIAHLLLERGVDPEHILAVTFTNKAAREMKERLEALLAREAALAQFGRLWDDLGPFEQKNLRSRIYREYTKHLWIGTFHSLCARMLRYDIDKFTSPQGQQWQKNFTILDESDAQSLIKEVVLKDLGLDEKRFPPKTVRYAISNAKNRGWFPDRLAQEESGLRGKQYARAYERYQARLAANNALDFDDLILLPVQLFRQRPDILDYWHRRFAHILVDEYQDTNRTQYDLIRLLATNGTVETPNWEGRSVFAVGDADQSIYSFRLADFTILLEFQQTFGDGLPDDRTKTLVKLEENYRSVANILTLANSLIEHNQQRIDKVLRPTRPKGDPIAVHRADDEVGEARFVVSQMRRILQEMPSAHPGHLAVLYRTNAQSRPFEEQLVRANIPYKVVGGLRFYDRKEIKDALAYLRLLVNPYDTLSLARAVGAPKRGIGATTLAKVTQGAATLGLPLWDLLQDRGAVHTLVGRSANKLLEFVALLQRWQERVPTLVAADIVTGILHESGYWADLQSQDTDEARDRLANLQELTNAALQYAEENEDASLGAFLENAALASSLDEGEEGGHKVSLMTLHAAKGLEFPVVFLVGLEQGLFPSFRSLDDPLSLEEERRLMYVGITRAQEKLFLCHAAERRLYQNREPAVPSQFLRELPAELLVGDVRQRPTRPPQPTSPSCREWRVGDRLHHTVFGEGKVIAVLGTGARLCLAVEFPGQGKRILDPRQSPLEKMP
ncbi:MAG: UvrD-helicase domain-containing protein [Pseudanabaenaceae cyanobacterium]